MMTCLCSHNKMFVSDCCWAHDHLDLRNKPPLMVRGWNGGAGTDPAYSETVTRGEVLQNQQPHDCDGFMFVFKPTNDRDQNVFLQPFTDVKIRSKSHPLTPEKGDVKEEARQKKELFLYILAKTQPDATCLCHWSAETLPWAWGSWLPWRSFKDDSTLEAGKGQNIHWKKENFFLSERQKLSLMWFLICGKCKWWFLCRVCCSVLVLCKRTQLSVSLKLRLQLSRGRVGEEELFTAALFWLVSNNIEIVRGILATAQGK